VYFGAWVQVESDCGGRRTTHWYRLVGPDEFDRAEAYISMDSPLGRALLGKRLDDEFSVALPGGTTLFAILAVQYGGEDPPGA
jgi:transcription elongation factor GreB